ncbi:MAG: alkaline phosphatase D family protein [Halieaceae bacterium]|nr:alkaline phosphatase D family protein [Halieaceae bacterium]
MRSYFPVKILVFSACIFLMRPICVVADAPYLGMGAKSGEVTSNSAIVHVRLTESVGQKFNHSIPGKLGKARIHYSLSENMEKNALTEWMSSSSDTDYYLQFEIPDLKADTRYYYRAEMIETTSDKERFSDIFSFKTAPMPTDRKDIHFQVTTCQSTQGLPTYSTMLSQNPDFLVSAGDTVYYDKFDVRSEEEAYWIYQKDYGTPYTINYFARTSAYFMKDDHDYRYNDADPYSDRAINTSSYIEGPNGVNQDLKRADKTWLTHNEGIEIFKRVFPSSEKPYRTFRWGKGIQIWLLEGRDFSSENKIADSPDKTIWGQEQKKWLQETLLNSDADFRVIISPTPLIGPDKPHKRDNHANQNGFMVEGRNFMDWMIKEGITDNTFFICGDRHWQYHSIYRELVHEFCSGPTSQFKVQRVPKPEDGVIEQPYNGPTGGFLSVKYTNPKLISFEHYNERGKLQNIKTFSH